MLIVYAFNLSQLVCSRPEFPFWINSVQFSSRKTILPSHFGLVINLWSSSCILTETYLVTHVLKRKTNKISYKYLYSLFFSDDPHTKFPGKASSPQSVSPLPGHPSISRHSVILINNRLAPSQQLKWSKIKNICKKSDQILQLYHLYRKIKILLGLN